MPNLAPVAARLRQILERYVERLDVTQDGGGGMSLERPGPKSPASYFGGIRVGKLYVSYYLMPVYGRPQLLDGMSLELRRRMQGKSCFNFTAIEEPLLRELETLTARSFDAFSSDACPRVPVSSRG
jgi:hypothetical protein